MPNDRFFIDQPLEENVEVFLENDEFVHLSRVMRAQKGDIVELVNGRYALAEAKITEMRPKSAALLVAKITKQLPKTTKLILAQALCHASKLELIVEKSTELGIHGFIFFKAARSIKDTLSEAQMLRLKKVAISALKQCGRLDLPSIAFASSITEALPENAAAFFGDTRKEAPLFLLPQNKSACIFIGPEKGFSPAELTILENMPACGMRLNANILRCETAAITAAAIAGYATERNNDDYQN